jgi:hypothetical protein
LTCSHSRSAAGGIALLLCPAASSIGCAVDSQWPWGKARGARERGINRAVAVAHARLYAAKALAPRAPWAKVHHQAHSLDEGTGTSAITHDELARGEVRALVARRGRRIAIKHGSQNDSEVKRNRAGWWPLATTGKQAGAARTLFSNHRAPDSATKEKAKASGEGDSLDRARRTHGRGAQAGIYRRHRRPPTHER